MKNLLKKRQRLSPVRLEMTGFASRKFHSFFCEKLRLSSLQVFNTTAPLDVTFVLPLEYAIDRNTAKRLLWKTHTPAETLSSEKKQNMIKTIANSDLLLSFPYESASPLLELIRQASEDASVLSIKITLYRIDVQSKLAELLLKAAENGKEIVVLMELRARFDENNNIEWTHRLEEAGCRVIYGLAGYKVHSKICLITRKESGKIQYITQFGTGNYSEITARQYTDLALFTANYELGRDAAEFFINMLLGNLDGTYSRLWVAPSNLKSSFIQHIEEEMQKAATGASGRIIIKCNSLTDRELIEKLIEASSRGVEVSLIIRGICCLIPQIPGLTENIRIISIVGRFLEHSRIFLFGNDQDKKVYISSADLMTRNTERRVEIACPVIDQQLKERIYQMLETMLRDNIQAWEQYSDGNYLSHYRSGSDHIISSQEFFIQEARIRSLNMESSKGMTQNANDQTLWGRAAQWIKKLFQ